MNQDTGENVLRLRAHHACCLPFFKPTFENRSPGFNQVVNRIKSAMLSQPETMVMIIEGTDELCHQCPVFIDGRCSSPQGDEDAVRKWDVILLKELGVSFGTCQAAGEWQALIRQKSPFKICQKCQWQQVCSIGGDLS